MKVTCVAFHYCSLILGLLFQTVSVLILLRPPIMQQDITLRPCAGPYVLKRKHKSWALLWVISVVCVSRRFVTWHIFIIRLLVCKTVRRFVLCWTKEQNTSRVVPRVVETIDTGGSRETVVSRAEESFSKRTYKMKKVCGADEMGHFFVTGATDAAEKPSHFYCRIYRKDMSVLTHGVHENLQHFHGLKHFPRDQRLRLETPSCRFHYYEGNPMTEDEVEWPRERTLRSSGGKVQRAPIRRRPHCGQFLSTSASLYWGKCQRWLKHCVWAGAANLSTNRGANSFLSLGKST